MDQLLVNTIIYWQMTLQLCNIYQIIFARWASITMIFSNRLSLDQTAYSCKNILLFCNKYSNLCYLGKATWLDLVCLCGFRLATDRPCFFV